MRPPAAAVFEAAGGFCFCVRCFAFGDILFASSRVDSKLRPRPTENLLADRKDAQETLVSCASLGTFCAHRKYPAGGMDQPILPPIPPQKKRTAVGIGHYKSFG